MPSFWVQQDEQSEAKTQTDTFGVATIEYRLSDDSKQSAWVGAPLRDDRWDAVSSMV